MSNYVFCDTGVNARTFVSLLGLLFKPFGLLFAGGPKQTVGWNDQTFNKKLERCEKIHVSDE